MQQELPIRSLVGAHEQRERDSEPQRVRTLEIDDKFDFVDCCTGKSEGFSPPTIRPA